jgi:hypothetical protein
MNIRKKKKNTEKIYSYRLTWLKTESIKKKKIA